MSKARLVDLTVTKHHETRAAYLISTDGVTKVWVPKSAVELEPGARPGIHTLTLPEGLAIEKGLV